MVKNDICLKFRHFHHIYELVIASKVAISPLNLPKYNYRVLNNFSTAGESSIYDIDYSRRVEAKGGGIQILVNLINIYNEMSSMKIFYYTHLVEHIDMYR